jgi:phage gp36-like protein
MADYCSDADMNARFGTDNITQWATLTSSDDAATILARKATARSVAQAEMDDILRCIESYESKLPLTTVPTTVTDKVAIRAGLWLYGPHATDDSQQQPGMVQWYWRVYRQWVNEVRAGKYKLDIS